MMGVFDDVDAQIAAESGKATVPAGSMFGAAPNAPAPLDKYQQAAKADLARPAPYGMAGYTGRVGMGIPWSDEIQAAAMTPLEMIRKGTWNPAEGYSYAKARENMLNEQTRANTPGGLGVASEAAGALATGAGVLGGGTRAAALTVGGRTIPAPVVNWGANTAKATGLGAFAGAGEGDTLEERGKRALIGGALGGALGGVVLPAAATSIPKIAAAAQLPRLRDPEKIATEQIAKVARDAGVSMAELENRMAAARAAGQPDFTVADALGKEAQRKLAAVAKVPGPARESITETLTARDLNMPTRIGEEVGRKLGAPDSAQAARDVLIKTASDKAAPLYRQAEGVTTWSPKLEEFWNHPDVQKGLAVGVRRQARDAVGTGQPFDPNHYGITNFNAAGDPIITGVPNMKSIQAAKVGLDEMIDKNRNEITGKLTAEGRSLADMQRRMLTEIDSINPVYRQARQAYAGPMQTEEAIRFGQRMPTEGRAVDNIRQFENRTPTAQQGIRIGVADKVRGDLERTGNIPTYLREKSLKGQQELEAISPYGPATLREALAREEQMQRTSRQALGGSQTAENLADMSRAPGGAEALGLIGNAGVGNFMGAARNAIELAKRAGQGESEAQRSAIARALLANEPAAVAAMQQRIAEHELRRRGVNPFVDRPSRYRPGE